MARSVVATSIILALGASPARAQDAPVLTPPTLEAPAEALAPSTPAPTAAASKPAPKEPGRPLLLIPGVTAPLAPRTALKPTNAPMVGKPATPPVLDGPATSRSAPAMPGATLESRLRGDDLEPKVTLPLTLEPIPPDEEEDTDAKHPLGRSGDHRQSSPGRSENDPGSSASRRHPGAVLGRILGTEDDSSESKSGITIESRTDPAVEAAVKRRVEKQIQESLGDRVKNVEVRVSGRNVAIRAHATRFWQRRSVRRSLDTLPLPSGYRGRAELID